MSLQLCGHTNTHPLRCLITHFALLLLLFCAKTYDFVLIFANVWPFIFALAKYYYY